MEVTIEKIVYTGKSLARVNGKVVLTDEGLPGEIVKINPVKEKKTYVEAETTEILKKSDERITPRCAHYKSCSPYQYIDYPHQLKIKEFQVREIFARDLKIALADITVRPSPRIWGYRNKARLKVIWENGGPRLAYHIPQTRDKFVEIDECFLLPREMTRLFAAALKLLAEEKASFVGELEVKESFSEKNFLLIFYTDSSANISKLSNIPLKLKSDFHLQGAVCLIRKNRKLKEKSVFGENFIEEKVGGKTFRFGAQSFFQVNVDMPEALIKDIKNSIPLTGKETIADLYCGVGTFGITLSENAGKVVGVESEWENISFLKKNLLINGISKNFDVREGHCEKLIADILKQKVDLIVIDPPRRGIGEIMCEKIIKHDTRFIVYISCNPSTLTRDLKTLLKKYRLSRIYLYDFFPHTTHIETCAILEM